MMRRVRIHAAAAEEAAEAAAWYEKERAGLGADFERAVDAARNACFFGDFPTRSSCAKAGPKSW